MFDNAGQDCCARSRILVQAAVYDRFMEHFEPAVKAVRVIDPSDERSEMGPLISAEQRENVAAFVPDGAPVAFRGSAPQGAGFWYPADRARTGAADSPRGPRGDLRPGRRGAALHGRGGRDPDRQRHALRALGLDLDPDVGRAFRVSRAVETGAISVNSNSSVRYWTPFGGFKQSGLGRELGPDALEAFTELKNVFIATQLSART